MYKYIYIYIYITYVYTYVCMHVCLMFVCMYVGRCISLYIHLSGGRKSCRTPEHQLTTGESKLLDPQNRFVPQSDCAFCGEFREHPTTLIGWRVTWAFSRETEHHGIQLFCVFQPQLIPTTIRKDRRRATPTLTPLAGLNGTRRVSGSRAS